MRSITEDRVLPLLALVGDFVAKIKNHFPILGSEILVRCFSYDQLLRKDAASREILTDDLVVSVGLPTAEHSCAVSKREVAVLKVRRCGTSHSNSDSPTQVAHYGEE